MRAVHGLFTANPSSLVLGVTLSTQGISVANTMMMTTSNSRHELAYAAPGRTTTAVLRLVGFRERWLVMECGQARPEPLVRRAPSAGAVGARPQCGQSTSPGRLGTQPCMPRALP